jgi:hypothetical protein
VYWPFTITALLNLYDYSHNDSVKQKAQALLDNMATQVGAHKTTCDEKNTKYDQPRHSHSIP